MIILKLKNHQYYENTKPQVLTFQIFTYYICVHKYKPHTYQQRTAIISIYVCVCELNVFRFQNTKAVTPCECASPYSVHT